MSSGPYTASAAPLADFAGVYVAKPQRILIGPLLHLEHFISAPAGDAFAHAGGALPPIAHRYVVDCAPQLSDLPPMPAYATVPTLVGEEGRAEDQKTTTAVETAAPSVLPPPLLLSSPPAPPHLSATVSPTAPPLHDTTTRNSNAAAAGGVSSSAAAWQRAAESCEDGDNDDEDKTQKTTVCPSTMALHVDAAHGMPNNAHAASTTNAAPLSAAAVASMSTSEVLRRMQRNAEEAMARLRQRCELNGMSTSAFTSVRHPNPSLTQSSRGSSTSAVQAAPSAAQSEGVSNTPTTTPPPPPVAAAAAATKAGTTAAVEGGVSSVPPLPSNATATAAAKAGPSIASLPKAKAELFAQAKLNEELHAMAETKLGPGHVLRCLIPPTDDSLSSAAVQDTIQQLERIFAAEPEAQVYVYSLDGKGTASALAALYLVQVDRVALSEVLQDRLPACTPRISCLAQLMGRDPQPQLFDKAAYLRRYLARRYPTASAASIEAAVSTCKGNVSKAERLIRLEMSFQHSSVENAPSRASRRSTGSAGFASVSNVSSAAHNNNNNNNLFSASPRGLHTYTSSADPENSLSEFSLCSSFIKDSAQQLSEGDEATIDSLYRALADGRVGVSRDEVRDSYLAHHRSQDLVLRQFLLRFRLPSQPSTPQKVRPATSNPYNNNYYSSSNNCYPSAHSYRNNGNSGCVTPTSNLMEEISLPHFASQSASRRASAVAGSARVGQRPSAESCLSPEPTAPSVASALTPVTPTPPAARVWTLATASKTEEKSASSNEVPKVHLTESSGNTPTISAAAFAGAGASPALLPGAAAGASEAAPSMATFPTLDKETADGVPAARTPTKNREDVAAAVTAASTSAMSTSPNEKSKTKKTKAAASPSKSATAQKASEKKTRPVLKTASASSLPDNAVAAAAGKTKAKAPLPKKATPKPTPKKAKTAVRA